jgi:2-polyprenyl-3-methyl-5-hydroxy-6-metoxy-1,4-benzoquinol methylase
VDDQPLVQVVAQQYREDLHLRNVGDGAYAFVYEWPLTIDLERNSISAVIVNTGFRLRMCEPLESRSVLRPPLDWGPMSIVLDVNHADLESMHDHINDTWAQLGNEEPHWSVLTHPKFKTASIAQYNEEFFETGRKNIGDFRAFVCRSGLNLPRNAVCLELGCGVGRLTRWLSPLFARVIAADISATHLEIAKTSVAQHGIQNVVFHQLRTLKEFDQLEEFDVFFSVIVFQHNPPPVIAHMLRAVLSRLRPEGLGYFQIPTYAKDYEFVPSTYLSQIKKRHDMEMHVLPQNSIYEIVYASGCKLLEVREDGWTGNPDGISNTFLISKER